MSDSTLETRARVVQLDGAYALVLPSQGGGCGQCSDKGCGAGKLSGLFCSKPRQFRVDNRLGASVGDEVIVAVEDGTVLRGIGLMYLLPLVVLLIGAWLGSELGAHDGYSALGALLGLFGGFVSAKWWGRRPWSRQSAPYIARHWC
ncbi:MAG: SoxR reducing system RseC family protein [Gallionella sp.]|nr:SoxR reducing system RseC family protein [Gallionella sp.]